MSKSIYVSFSDNGMGLSRTRWARCLFDATIAGAFGSRKITHNHFSSPYPNVICNIIAEDFLRTKCDELFLCDMDIVFTPENLSRLLSHNLPYVGGIVPKRVPGLELAVWPHEPWTMDPGYNGDAPLISADFGRGFCVIHRDVFKTVAPHVPVYEDDVMGERCKMHEFFQFKTGGHSEDFAFCEHYRRLGGNPVIDQSIFVRHEGSVLYPIHGTY